MEVIQMLQICRSDGNKEIVKLTGNQNMIGNQLQAIPVDTKPPPPKESHVVIAVLPPNSPMISPESISNFIADPEKKLQLSDAIKEEPGVMVAKRKRLAKENNDYPCSICGKVFACSAYLVLHMRTHTGERPYRCKICDKTFKDQSGLNRHTRIHNGARPYKCKYCGMAFKQSTHRNTHVQAHELRDAGVERKPNTKSNAGEGIPRPFQCKVCGKSFPTKIRLKCHEKMHSEEKPFTCVHCGVGFRRKHAKVIHERSHTGHKPYPCSYCDKGFVCSTQRKCHERRHTGEKPYPCDVCGQTFSSSSGRASHIANRHTNPLHSRTEHPRPGKLKTDPKMTTKQFKCPDCSRSFALELSLNIHLNLVHEKKVIN